MKNLCTIICMLLVLSGSSQSINFELYDPSGGFLKIICGSHQPTETTSFLKNNKAVATLQESDLFVTSRQFGDSVFIQSFYSADSLPAVSYTLLRKGRELLYVGYKGYDQSGALIGYAHHLTSGKGIVLVKDHEQMGVEVYRGGHPIAQYGVARIEQERLIVFPPGNAEKLQGVLDMNGDMLVPVQYRKIKLEENVFVATDLYDKTGAFDINGQSLVPFEFDNVIPLSHLLVTWVNIRDNEQANYGLYHKTGGLISNPVNELFDFSEGVVPVIGDQGLYGFVDSTGKMITGFDFKSARKFSEGLAAVANEQGEYGFIDQTGQVVVPYKFYNVVMNFDNGRAKVAESRFKKPYLIDRSGKKIE